MARNKRSNSKSFGDHEAIVSVGNTPSYLVELLRIDFAQRGGTILNVPISGHPGIARRVDGWMSDLVTVEGLKSYREYLQHIGFYDLVHTRGRIWFTDIVAQGGGIAFLLDKLYRRALDLGINIENKVHIMALNETTQLNFYGIIVKPNRFIPLNLSCAYTLHQCNNSWRMIKSFPIHK